MSKFFLKSNYFKAYIAFLCCTSLPSISQELPDLSSIKPFRLGMQCKEAQKLMSAMKEGSLPDFQIYRQVPAYLGWCPPDEGSTHKSYNTSPSEQSWHQIGGFKGEDPPSKNRYVIITGKAGFVEKIEMVRDWTGQQYPPKRSDLVDSLIARYGKPLAIRYYLDPITGSIELAWGITSQRAIESGSQRTLQTYSQKKVIDKIKLDCTSSFDIKGAAACIVKRISDLAAPHKNALAGESKVLLVAMISVDNDTRKVEKLEVELSDVLRLKASEKEIIRRKEEEQKIMQKAAVPTF